MKKLVTLFVCLAAALAAQGNKQYKSQAEYQLYNAATTAIRANDFAKALTSLDTWKQNYPDSDYKDDRQFLYVLAYAGAQQPAQAIDTAAVVAYLRSRAPVPVWLIGTSNGTISAANAGCGLGQRGLPALC